MRYPPLLAVLAFLATLPNSSVHAGAFVSASYTDLVSGNCPAEQVGSANGIFSPTCHPTSRPTCRTSRGCSGWSRQRPWLGSGNGSDPGGTKDGGGPNNDLIPRREEATAPSSPSSSSKLTSRRSAILRAAASALPLLVAAETATVKPSAANAAPPMAVIAEELGYFPVTNRNGDTVYVPARAKRTSTAQSVELATFLESTGAKMYGAYWCPHCSRQKEMFGREGWSHIKYVECSPKGYGANVNQCSRNGVDGYPTWKFGNGKTGSGEMTLERIADMAGYKGTFDGGLEEPLPVGGGSCR